MSLFLKIFLWFWLAMALTVGAVILVNRSTSSEPLARQWQTFVGEAITSNAETGVQIYKNEGPKGLQEYLSRLEQRRRVNRIAFYDGKGNLLAGREIAGTGELLKRAYSTGKAEFEREEKVTLAAIKAKADDGSEFVYVVEINRFRPPTFFTPRLLFQILAVVLVGGLVCYALARYLTIPITKLRGAAQLLAEGNFETRVSDKIGNRRDEVALLAKDFDEMAGRIEILINSEKRLTQDISHELRSPLARINVALELARSKSNPETLPMLDRLESESKRLNNLISELLTISKLETGSVAFEMFEINLTKLVTEIVSDAHFEATALSRGVELTGADRVSVKGNEPLLRRAIENVLRNATRYTPEGTNVNVSLKSDLHVATLEIRDFGSGVPEEELDKLFRPFYRLSESRDRKSGGVGLGLAIAERAVNSHDGSIAAVNTGKGLSVTITLPVSS